MIKKSITYLLEEKLVRISLTLKLEKRFPIRGLIILYLTKDVIIKGRTGSIVQFKDDERDDIGQNRNQFSFARETSPGRECDP